MNYTVKDVYIRRTLDDANGIGDTASGECGMLILLDTLSFRFFTKSGGFYYRFDTGSNHKFDSVQNTSTHVEYTYGSNKFLMPLNQDDLDVIDSTGLVSGEWNTDFLSEEYITRIYDENDNPSETVAPHNVFNELISRFFEPRMCYAHALDDQGLAPHAYFAKYDRALEYILKRISPVTYYNMKHEADAHYEKHLKESGDRLCPSPVGTIVQGRYKEFGLPVPKNLWPVNGTRITDGNAHPSLFNKVLTSWEGRVIAVERPNTSGQRAGNTAGTNTQYINRSNLPTDTFTFNGGMSGSIDGKLDLTWADSYNGDPKIWTNRSSHSHKMYGDSASDVRGSSGGAGSDLVLNNNDGRQRVDYWNTNSSSVQLYITANQIMDKLAVDLNNKSVRVSGSVSGKLNTGRYGMENRQQTVYAETYMVIY